MSRDVRPSKEATADDYARAIKRAWQNSFDSILDVGRLLAEAKEHLAHGEFESMVAAELPFGPRAAQMLMKVALDSRLTKANHGSLLPLSWRTLYELTKLDDATLDACIADGTIHPDMERKAVAAIAKRERRAEREVYLGAKQKALPSKRYGVILADPEWKFETWSENGMDRHAANHYSTSATEVIASRDVASIAADDCVLFLWATAPMLPQALQVMAAWGFEYKSQWIWDKQVAGTGYWNRNRHELLLVGTRGNIPAPAPGQQWESIIASPKGDHSEKPEWQYELIGELYPNLPKIELNARADNPPPKGWDVWGNEAPETEAAE